MKIYNHDEFLAEAVKVNDYVKNNKIVFVSNFNGLTKPISCKCTECGKVWETQARLIFRGSGCPSCAKKNVVGRRKHSPEDLKKELCEKNYYYRNGLIDVLDIDFKNNIIKFSCKYDDHFDFVLSINDALSGKNCPTCENNKATKKGLFYNSAVEHTCSEFEKWTNKCNGKNIDTLQALETSKNNVIKISLSANENSFPLLFEIKIKENGKLVFDKDRFFDHCPFCGELLT